MQRSEDGYLVDKLGRRRMLSIQKACALVPGSCWVPGPEFLEVLTDSAIKQSAYDTFYRWLVDHRDTPVGEGDFYRLHNLVVVGADTMKYLNARETRRIRACSGLRGDKLKHAVSWSNCNGGPQELVNGLRISGNVVLFKPRQ